MVSVQCWGFEPSAVSLYGRAATGRGWGLHQIFSVPPAGGLYCRVCGGRRPVARVVSLVWPLARAWSAGVVVSHGNELVSFLFEARTGLFRLGRQLASLALVLSCASVCCAVLCCALLCCAALLRPVLRCALLCRAVPCRAVPCRAFACCGVSCLAMPCRAVPCHDAPCRGGSCRLVPKLLIPKNKRPGCLPTGKGTRAGLCVLCARRA